MLLWELDWLNMSVPFLVANFRNYGFSNAARPTSGTASYISGSNTAGTATNIPNAYNGSGTALDTTTKASVSAGSGSNLTQRVYGITYSGFGSGTFTGQLKVYIYASCIDDGGGQWATVNLQYSLNGTSYITTGMVEFPVSSDGSGVGATWGPGAITPVSLSNVDLSLFKVRITCNGAMDLSSPYSYSSNSDIYDIVFVY
jgi:hypothetical protein